MSDTFDFRCSECVKNNEGEYRLHSRCSNCGTEGVAVHSKSHDALSDTCPVCECIGSVKPSHPRVLVSSGGTENTA